MIKTSTGQKIYLGLGLLLMSYYLVAETRGWASGGTKRKPLSPAQLKQSDIGYRNRIFWFHGYRGK